MTPQRLTIVMFAILASSIACTDRSIDSLVGHLNGPSFLRDQDATIEVRPIERFQVSLEARGSLRPAEPVTLDLAVTANVSTPEVLVRIDAPELLAPRETSGRILPGVTVDASREFRSALSAGQSISRTLTLTFPKAGYYRVSLAAAAGVGSETTREGRPVSGAAVAEAWIWIHEDSGRVSPTLDTSVYGKEYVRTVGPRSRRTPFGVAPSAQQLVSECDTWRAVYWNQDDAQVQVIPSGVVDGVITEDYSGAAVASINTTLGSDGTFSVCVDPGYGYSGTIHLFDQFINIQNPVDAGYFGGGPTTGATYDLVVNSSAARVFTNMRAISSAAQTRFGLPRGALGVRIATCPSVDNSCYRLSEDRVYIKPTHVWNGPSTFGAFLQAHEFGHAYHHTTLGGIVSPNCPDEHFLHLPSGLNCAYSEGTASFIGVVAFGEAFNQTIDYEQNVYYLGGDGAQIEGAVTSLLQDLFDDSATPDGLSGDDDDMSLTAPYLGSVIRTCNVSTSGVWSRAHGIDHLTYCMERQIDPAVVSSPVYFASRQVDPSAFAEGAVEPVSWSQFGIRERWRFDLYDEAVGSFPLDVTIQGQTEVPSGSYCTWFAYVSGGQPPYRYEWSGLFSGSGYALSATVTTGGNLRVDVTSGDGQTASVAVPIAISPSEPPCVE